MIKRSQSSIGAATRQIFACSEQLNVSRNNERHSLVYPKT